LTVISQYEKSYILFYLEIHDLFLKQIFKTQEFVVQFVTRHLGGEDITERYRPTSSTWTKQHFILLTYYALSQYIFAFQIPCLRKNNVYYQGTVIAIFFLMKKNINDRRYKYSHLVQHTDVEVFGCTPATDVRNCEPHLNCPRSPTSQ